MFTLLTNGDRRQLDDLNDVLRIARADDPVYVATPRLDAGRRPALGHDRRMATVQPPTPERVRVDEDQDGDERRPQPSPECSGRSSG